MDANTYLAIAKRNLKTAKTLYDAGDYNDAARYAQQSVEKVLKHLLETLDNPEMIPYMKLHNVKRLYKIASEHDLLTYDGSESRFMAALTDYYYDTNYPGENFEMIDAFEASEAYEFAKVFTAKYFV